MPLSARNLICALARDVATLTIHNEIPTQACAYGRLYCTDLCTCFIYMYIHTYIHMCKYIHICMNYRTGKFCS